MPDGNRSPVRWGDSGPFAVVPVWILRAAVSDRAVRLYAILAGYAGSPEGATFRGKTQLAEDLGCAKSSIEKATSELVAIGAVTVERTKTESGGHGQNGYVIHATPIPRAEGVSPAPAGEGSPDHAGVPPYRDLRAEETSNEVSSGIPEAEASKPPKVLLVEGQNLGFNALAKVCGVDPKGNRAGEIAAALNGSKAKGLPHGIRALVHRAIEEGRSGPRPDSPEGFERFVVAQIRIKAARYRQTMSGAMLTPLALAKWWTDLDQRHGVDDPAARLMAQAQRLHEEGR